MTEDQLEQQCLQWFAEGGWEIAQGPEIGPEGPNPERQNYTQVLLLKDVEAAIGRINPHLPTDAIEQALTMVAKPASLDLTISNRTS